MKILITGSRGFIGTHVRAALLDIEADERPEIVECDSFEPRVHLDGRDPSVAHPIASRFIPPSAFEDVDVVIHLAAQVGVADSWDEPSRYLEDNTYDTSQLMESIRMARSKPKRIVVASSMSIYGDPETPDAINELHPVRPASIYGLTKFDQETLVRVYGEALGISTVALRFFNVYGPGQALHNPYTGVMAIFANAILNQKSPTVYEDGLQTRDFIYVQDVAEVVAEAALGSSMGGIYNVSTGAATTIYEVAHQLSKALHRPWLAPHVTHEKRPGDIRHCVGDASRLREALPWWEPRDLATGLSEYVRELTRV